MPLFAGNTWFRDNIIPYLTKIKAEINANSGCCSPPIVTSFNPPTFPINTVTTVTLIGDFFTPSLVITCGTATISNFQFITQQQCTFDITTNTGQVNTVDVSNGGGSVNISVESITSSWVDLRVGSSSVFTEEHSAGITVVRDAEGIGNTGNLWGTWLRFPSHSWDRVSLKKCSIIVKNATLHMAGLMSTENQNETSASQYYEAEIYVYMNGSAQAFYGSNAAGIGVSDLHTAIAIPTPYYKIEFNNNGQVGSQFKVFGLSNLTNFDDVSNLLGTWTVGTSMTANDVPIMPCITMTGATRIVAFKIEDA